MKTMRRNGMIMVTLVMLIGLTVAIVACGQTGQLGASEPNASLSNDDLVSVAITNMNALKTYHAEFDGEVFNQAGDTKPREHLTLSIDDQVESEGRRLTARYGYGGTDQSIQNDSVLSMGRWFGDQWILGIILTAGGGYGSEDGGKTWSAMSGEGEMYLTGYTFAFGLLWDQPRGWPSAGDMGRSGESALADLIFKDGSPRSETLDGTLTRHIVAEVIPSPLKWDQTLAGTWMYQADRVDLWVSTGITPTIRQMRVEGGGLGSQQAAATAVAEGGPYPTAYPYTLTWHWSRFNEDFGEVKPPPAEMIDEP